MDQGEMDCPHAAGSTTEEKAAEREIPETLLHHLIGLSDRHRLAQRDTTTGSLAED